LPREDFVILVVGGAWGIGNLKKATRCAAGSAAYTVVVTGNNISLEKRLAAEFSCE
jgi:UDP-N-acetylglucosamine:LPS N-acetylglucosamine transferase